MKNLALMTFVLIVLTGVIFAVDCEAKAEQHIFPALGAPADPKVAASWNRYHDCQALGDILKRLHNAYPDLTRLYSIGMSYEGRQIWCLEVTNRKKGDPQRKPGMYIDGNLHGNEVQASEVVAYTAWYLCENYGKVEKITQLVDDRVFYLLPTINPDGRDHWFHKPNTPHSSRSGKKPLDNDRDGLIDEDGTDDLNGDGNITQMRIQDPNGRYKPDPDYPNLLMVRVKADELGDYSILGLEGIDNDGDGQINEDGPGGYDSNRNWAFDWQPHYVQYGAHEFPFSLPNTHAVAQFVLSHPNIAAGQTYHNNGGMILRGPGREGGVSNGSDDRVLSEIARKGEMMLPYYRSLVCWSGLYSVWGGEFDWFYGARGIMMYCNELWTAKNMFRNDNTDRKAGTDFLKYLLLEQGIVEWEEYDHPTYGKIEIGGTSQYFRRIPPSFLLEEECHRNMAFTLYHADSMPMVSFGEISVEPIGKDLFKVWIEICNDRLMPTRSTHEAKNDISQPDIVSLKGRQAEAISAGRVTERYFKRVDPVKVRPYRIELSSVEGMNSERVQFIVSGKGFVLVTFDSAKGGLIEKRIELK